ncbi:hypothetical protein NDU88_003265 [Pleurodeles waltl]|uniref:Uncharacterized protein n=1 Tax=Pleurodeles waltl TaxID=8319 RepID=A0AAV7VCV7_PLEWA|nr:hypothetical protein NDU88_003265 [Pleurodeles waltl]
MTGAPRDPSHQPIYLHQAVRDNRRVLPQRQGEWLHLFRRTQLNDQLRSHGLSDERRSFRGRDPNRKPSSSEVSAEMRRIPQESEAGEPNVLKNVRLSPRSERSIKKPANLINAIFSRKNTI